MARTGLTGVPGILTGWEREIAEELERVAEGHARRVAAEAQASHPYTDRTGDLTASIEALPAQGDALDGTLSASVVAGMDYAGYVEAAGFAFLEPAAERTESALVADAEAALARATRTG